LDVKIIRSFAGKKEFLQFLTIVFSHFDSFSSLFSLGSRLGEGGWKLRDVALTVSAFVMELSVSSA